MMTEKTDTTHILSDITFEERDDTHIALVHKDQGGPANGCAYKLVMKASNRSDEFFEQALKLKSTMEIDEFLVKYQEADLEALAKALGDKSVDQDDDYYADFITSKIQSTEVIKQLIEVDEYAEVLMNLTDDEHLAYLQDQVLLEKALKKIEKANKKNSESSSKPKIKLAKTDEDTPAEGTVEKSTSAGVGDKSSVDNKNKKEEKMTDTTIVVDKEVEMIEKAAFVDLQKSLDALKVELEKSVALNAQYAQEKKDAIAKSRKETLIAACGEQHGEVLFKAVVDADDAVFADVVKSLQAMQKAVEQSDLFKETGVSGSVEVQEESGVAALIKAKHYKQK